MTLELNTIHQGDCLELMKDIPDESIDMILCDLPYGTTSCKWDTIIPFEPLWEQYKRIVKPNAAIVLTASQPFTSMLVMSNLKWFKYEWIWEKSKASNYVNAKVNPMKYHENILVFGKNKAVYNPQMVPGEPYIKKCISTHNGNSIFKDTRKIGTIGINKGDRYPSTIIKFSNGNNKTVHPTQKPVALFEYLIKTYTNEGDLVLDNCAGSGTTGIAAQNLNRNYILIEQDQKYFQVAKKRLEENQGKHRQRNIFD